MARTHVIRARVFHRTGMQREAQGELGAVDALLADRPGYDFSAVWEGGEGELRFELALAHAEGRSPAGAISELARAIELGWCETPRLDAETALEPLRSRPDFCALRERVVPVPAPEV